MTQVSRYGHMLKVTVNGMRMRVKADGSVLNDTIQGGACSAPRPRWRSIRPTRPIW